MWHSNSNKSHQIPIRREILIVGYWTINGYAHITRFQIIFQIYLFSKISLQDIIFHTSKINQYLFLDKFHFLYKFLSEFIIPKYQWIFDFNYSFQYSFSIYLQKDKFSKYSFYIGKHFHTYLFISNSQILFIFNT